MENMQECLSYNSQSNQVGYYDNQNCWIPWDWNNYHTHYYPVYQQSIQVVEDKVSRSFKVVSKLLELGTIKNITVTEFIKIVEEISKVI